MAEESPSETALDESRPLTSPIWGCRVRFPLLSEPWCTLSASIYLITTSSVQFPMS